MSSTTTNTMTTLSTTLKWEDMTGIVPELKELVEGLKASIGLPNIITEAFFDKVKHAVTLQNASSTDVSDENREALIAITKEKAAAEADRKGFEGTMKAMHIEQKVMKAHEILSQKAVKACADAQKKLDNRTLEYEELTNQHKVTEAQVLAERAQREQDKRHTRQREQNAAEAAKAAEKAAAERTEQAKAAEKTAAEKAKAEAAKKDAAEKEAADLKAEKKRKEDQEREGREERKKQKTTREQNNEEELPKLVLKEVGKLAHDVEEGENVFTRNKSTAATTKYNPFHAALEASARALCTKDSLSTSSPNAPLKISDDATREQLKIACESLMNAGQVAIEVKRNVAAAAALPAAALPPPVAPRRLLSILTK